MRGVPLHAWCEDSFISIGCNWGKVIRVDDNTLKRNSLELGGILVHTEAPSIISDSIKLKIGKEIYKVQVLEVIGCNCLAVNSMNCNGQSAESEEDTKGHTNGVEAQGISFSSVDGVQIHKTSESRDHDGDEGVSTELESLRQEATRLQTDLADVDPVDIIHVSDSVDSSFHSVCPFCPTFSNSNPLHLHKSVNQLEEISNSSFQLLDWALEAQTIKK